MTGDLQHVSDSDLEGGRAYYVWDVQYCVLLLTKAGKGRMELDYKPVGQSCVAGEQGRLVIKLISRMDGDCIQCIGVLQHP